MNLILFKFILSPRYKVVLPYVLVAITSQIHPGQLDQDEFLLSNSDLTSGGLVKPSIIKLGKIVTIEKKLIIKSLGKLPSDTMNSVLNGLQNILHQ